MLYFAPPCLLLRFGINTPVLGLLNPAVLQVYLGCALLIVGITVPLSRNRRVGAEGRRVWRAGGGRRRFPTAGSWACRCWWHCQGRRLAGPLDVVMRVLAFGSFSALAWWFGARPVA